MRELVRSVHVNKVDVWDLPVRIFHWSLVATFVAAFLTAGVYQRIHEAAGYNVLALVVFRCFWGFVGTRHARFSDFVRSPWAVLSYVGRLLTGRAERHLGHNPAGGMMILALLGLSCALGITGWLQLTPAWFGDERMALVHKFVAYTAVALIPLHILGVVVGSVLHRENLVGAMLTGRKPLHEPAESAPAQAPTEWHRAANRFALLAVAVLAVMWWWQPINAQIEVNARRARVAAKVASDRLAKETAGKTALNQAPELQLAANTATIAMTVAPASTDPAKPDQPRPTPAKLAALPATVGEPDGVDRSRIPTALPAVSRLAVDPIGAEKPTNKSATLQTITPLEDSAQGRPETDKRTDRAKPGPLAQSQQSRIAQRAGKNERPTPLATRNQRRQRPRRFAGRKASEAVAAAKRRAASAITTARQSTRKLRLKVAQAEKPPRAPARAARRRALALQRQPDFSNSPAFLAPRVFRSRPRLRRVAASRKNRKLLARARSRELEPRGGSDGRESGSDRSGDSSSGGGGNSGPGGGG